MSNAPQGNTSDFGRRIGAPGGVKVPVNFKPSPTPVYGITPQPQPQAAPAPDYSKLIQYLTPAEQAQFENKYTETQQLQTQAKAEFEKLKSLLALQDKGPGGARMIQSYLKSNGYQNLAVDGSYGPQTANALKDYIGKVGPEIEKNANIQPFESSYTDVYTAGEKQIQGQADNARQQVLGKIQGQIDAVTKQWHDAVNANGGRDVVGDADLTKARAFAEQLKALRTKVLDPINGVDNHMALVLLDNFNRAEAQLAQSKPKPGHHAGFGLHSFLDAGKWVLDKGTSILYRPAEAIAAMQKAMWEADQGNSPGAIASRLGRGLQAGVGDLASLVRIPDTDISLVGLVAPGGSDARKAIEATNSFAEREKLVKEGQILSPGQILTNRVPNEYYQKHGGIGFYENVLGDKTKVIKPGKVDLSSGFGDLFFSVTTDPFALGSKLTDSLAKVGTRIGDNALRNVSKELIDQIGESGVRAQARSGYLVASPTGRALLDKAGEAVADLSLTADAKGLMRALPGLPSSVAEEAIAARIAAEGGATASRDAALSVIRDAFVSGKWDPTVSVIRQTLNATTSRAGIAVDGVAGVGRKAVILSDRLAYARRLGNAINTAAIFSGNPRRVLDGALDVSSRVANKTWRGAWADVVAHSVSSMSLEDRFFRVAEYANTAPAGFQRLFEANLSPFFNAASSSLKNIPLTTFIEDIWKAQPQDFELALRKVETLMAVHAGELGPKAAAQLSRDIAAFIATKGESNAIVKTAAAQVGLALPKGVRGATADSIAEEIGKLPSPELKQYFETRLDNARGAGLGAIQRDIESVLGSSSIREEVTRILGQVEDRAGDALASLPQKPGIGRRVVAKGARAILDLSEYSAPTELSFKDTKNEQLHAERRIDAVDRIAGAYKLNEAVRAQLRVEAGNVKSEEDLFRVAKHTVRAAVERYGIDQPDVMMDILTERGDFKLAGRQASVVRNFDPITGELVSDLQTLAQRVESVHMPRPDVLAGRIKAAILDGAVGSTQVGKLNSALRVFADKAGDIRIFGVLPDGIRVSARKAHQWWKFLIVTNAGMPLVGAVAGFVGAGGNLADRLRGAGLGFALGSASSARYIFRVGILEDRIRMFISDGLLPEVWIPGYSRFMERHYAADPFKRFMSEDLVRAGNYGASHFENDFLIHVDPNWGIVARDESRAPDAWWRIVNHQIHPESDPVIAILLREQAEHITTKEADQAIKQFLQTEEGAIWQDRWKGAYGGTGSAKKAVERMRGFVQTYTDPELAAMRVAGDVNGRPALIDRDTLKRKLKENAGPDAFHAQTTWKIPRNIKEVFNTWRSGTSELVMERPSLMLNRRPSAKAYFSREYDRLVRNGVDREEAQGIADAHAVRRSNSFMHKLDTQTRFAQKIDFWFPFQHAREDIAKVWTKLAVQHPGSTLRLVSYAARMFNNGVAHGIFEKNEFGDWQMSLPGAPRVSRALFGMPFEMKFSANIQDTLFVGSGAFGIGVLPSPGGPFWSIFSRQLANHYPELFQGKNPISSFLFPYGASGDLMRKDTSRLWMGLTGEAPPWEFSTTADWKNQLNRWQIEVSKELVYQNRVNGGSPDYVPSHEEVDDATKKFFTTWAFLGSITPATLTPTVTSKEKFASAFSAYTLGGVYGDPNSPGIIPFDTGDFLAKYPEFEAYLSGPSTKWTGPDDVNTLKRLGVGTDNEDYLAEQNTRVRSYLSWGEWRDQFATYRRTGDYYRELATAQKNPNPLQREYDIVAVQKKYADVVGKVNRDVEITTELHRIRTTYPPQLQDAAIQRLKTNYGLNNVTLIKYQRKLDENPDWLPSPWTEARQGFEVTAAVQKALGAAQSDRGTVEKYVGSLQPAEQARYWQHQLDALGYDNEVDNASAILDKYDYYRRQYFGVRNAFPFLYRSKVTEENPFTKLVSALKSNIGTQKSSAYNYIDHIQTEMDAAATNKQWSMYYSLKAQRDKVYDLVDALNAKLFQTTPDLTEYYNDLSAMHIYERVGNESEAHRMQVKALMDKMNAPFVRTSEETRFLDMPDQIKRAYLQDLVDGLDMPDGKIPTDVRKYLNNTYGAKKLFWEFLTPLQQQVLNANLPSNAVQNWIDESNKVLHGPKESTGKSFGHGSNLPGELAFAYQLFKEFNKRGGMAKPAAYDAYIALPKNPAIKAQFLQQHPEVAQYIRLGPLANMPPLYRELAINAMIKYGKFQGDVKTVSEVTDIAFAEQQLQTWTRRPKGALAPSTYETWVNMPTGVDKAAYLRAHPEVENWIRLGPMANMPDMYKQVVRDIMTRYGEWTQRQDPLGDTITQYYATPGYARDGFLQQHPELEVYWSLSRTPQEDQMFELQNTYFALQDVGARRAFLASHPDLQQHFVDARDQRYQQFLNQVAVYMGANPDMFQQYLQRQDDILSELLRRFAEPNMIREIGPATVVTQGAKEGGRQRQTANSSRT